MNRQELIERESEAWGVLKSADEAAQALLFAHTGVSLKALRLEWSNLFESLKALEKEEAK